MTICLFGLTGGLASGKSTVATHFRALGVPVIDADQVAREVVEPGSEGLAMVVSEFGPEVLTASGELDRKRLGEIVFADDDRRGALNRILHPRIAARTAERATELLSQGHRLACYEAALLVENGLADAFRPLVVVAVSRAVQLERAMQRDGLSAEEVEARLAAQLSLDAKVAQADYVIDNSGDLLATQAQAEDVLKKIRARLPEA